MKVQVTTSTSKYLYADIWIRAYIRDMWKQVNCKETKQNCRHYLSIKLNKKILGKKLDVSYLENNKNITRNFWKKLEKPVKIKLW